MQHRLFPLFIFILAIFILGAGSVYARFSEGNVFANIFFRMIFALPFYGLIMLKGKQYQRNAWYDKGLNIFLLMVVGMFFAFDTLFFFTAINYTSIGFTLLIATCIPIILLPLSVIVYREWPPLLFWPGLILAAIGMYLTIGTGKGGGTGNPEEWKGYLYAFASLVSFGMYMFFLKFCQTNLGIWQKMTYITLATAMTVAITSFISGNTLLLPTAISWLAILGLSLNSQLIGQSMLVFATHRLPLNLSGVLILALPFTGSLYGWLFFNETITWLGFAGMLLCLSGIYLTKIAYDNVESAHGHDAQEDDAPPMA